MSMIIRCEFCRNEAPAPPGSLTDTVSRRWYKVEFAHTAVVMSDDLGLPKRPWFFCSLGCMSQGVAQIEARWNNSPEQRLRRKLNLGR